MEDQGAASPRAPLPAFSSSAADEQNASSSGDCRTLSRLTLARIAARARCRVSTPRSIVRTRRVLLLVAVLSPPSPALPPSSPSPIGVRRARAVAARDAPAATVTPCSARRRRRRRQVAVREEDDDASDDDERDCAAGEQHELLVGRRRGRVARAAGRRGGRARACAARACRRGSVVAACAGSCSCAARLSCTRCSRARAPGGTARTAAARSARRARAAGRGRLGDVVLVRLAARRTCRRRARRRGCRA